MGREGEVVAELIPQFERDNPGIRVEVQQIPWQSAHEKLLTAFAGRVTPDVAQLGSSWVPGIRRAGRARAARRPAARFGDRAGRRLFRRASGPATSPAAAPSACPGIPTRACSSTAATCCARPASARSPGDWAGGCRRCGRSRRAASPNMACSCPTNEYEQLLTLRAPAGRAAAARGRPLRQFRARRASCAPPTSISACSRKGWRRG